MSALGAVFYRESKIRATNVTFIFWDLFYPLCYMLVVGVGVNSALGSPFAAAGVDYNAFFLAGVLGMASFGIASNTSWSFFLDRDNGIFYEMLTYPLEPLPAWFRGAALANPITWQIDWLRYMSIGLGDFHRIAWEALAFVGFAGAAFWGAVYCLQRQE